MPRRTTLLTPLGAALAEIDHALGSSLSLQGNDMPLMVEYDGLRTGLHFYRYFQPFEPL
jgi:hypothetical protein